MSDERYHKHKLSSAEDCSSKRILKVLLIEESLPLAEEMSRVFVSLNVSVDLVFSYAKAWELLNSHNVSFDIIFIPVIMHGTFGDQRGSAHHEHDGIDLLLQIKRDIVLSSIPIFMISSIVDFSITTFCIRNGAEAVVSGCLDASSIAGIFKQYRFAGHSAPGLSTSATISTGLVRVGEHAQPFRLLNSDGEITTYPGATKRHTIIFFVPSIFCEYLYNNENSCIPMLCEEVWSVCNSTDSIDEVSDASCDLSDSNRTCDVYCISGDLPCSLAEAKESFNLPFGLLSDPLLYVARKYVGTCDSDFADANWKPPQYPNSDLHFAAQKQRFAVLGYVVINKDGVVVYKWIPEHNDCGLLDYTIPMPGLKLK